MDEIIKKRAELFEIQRKQQQLEKRIEDLFRVSLKRDEIVVDRNKDWGRKGFSLNIFFDDFGITSFKKNIEKILGMIIEYQNLRRGENRILKEVELIDNMVKKDMENIEHGFNTSSVE